MAAFLSGNTTFQGLTVLLTTGQPGLHLISPGQASHLLTAYQVTISLAELMTAGLSMTAQIGIHLMYRGRLRQRLKAFQVSILSVIICSRQTSGMASFMTAQRGLHWICRGQMG